MANPLESLDSSQQPHAQGPIQAAMNAELAKTQPPQTNPFDQFDDAPQSSGLNPAMAHIFGSDAQVQGQVVQSIQPQSAPSEQSSEQSLLAGAFGAIVFGLIWAVLRRGRNIREREEATRAKASMGEVGDCPMDYYALLGVLPSIDGAALSAVYRALMKKYHPDVFSGSKDEAVRISKQLNEAYSVLGDLAKRAEYDGLRKAGGTRAA